MNSLSRPRRMSSSQSISDPTGRLRKDGATAAMSSSDSSSALDSNDTLICTAGAATKRRSWTGATRPLRPQGGRTRRRRTALPRPGWPQGSRIRRTASLQPGGPEGIVVGQQSMLGQMAVEVGDPFAVLLDPVRRRRSAPCGSCALSRALSTKLRTGVRSGRARRAASSTACGQEGDLGVERQRVQSRRRGG